MAYDYSMVKSADDKDFQQVSANYNFKDLSKFTKSDDEDVSKIERLLDVREGALKGDEYYLENTDCECGRRLTFYDFVFTAIVDAAHPKSFILHTLTGSKKIINNSRIVRCSNCCRQTGSTVMYGMPRSYLCTSPGLI